MKLIVGLGNPGNEYTNNRHNIGFIILDNYLKDKNLNFKEKFSSIYAKENINNENIFYQKPLTYMNLSGKAIYDLISFYKIDTKKDLLVIYDDMDINIGEIKIKKNGKSGGHNGIKSIISYIGEEFTRLKIGISKPKNDKNIISHVLGNFSKEELNILNNLNDIIKKAINDFINNIETEKLMSKYNIKIKNKKDKDYKIRKAKIEDIKRILEIKENAISYQIENNNIQWSNNYPTETNFYDDIEKKQGYILEKDNKIYGYAALCYGIDEMYTNTIDGYIENNINYSVIHRIMIDKENMKQNLATKFIEKLIRISCKDSIFVIRIDTHKNNKAMLKVIEKLKFKYIAKVYACDKTERDVFEIVIGGKI